MPGLILTGAHIKVYINEKLYKEVQSVSFQIDYGEEPIFGIDAAYAQEIGTTRVNIRGKVSGLRVKQSGGLQGINARPLFTDIAASPYISIRIQDRQSKEDIAFFPRCKISNEQHAGAAKQTYKLSFDFVAQIPLMALDRS